MSALPRALCPHCGRLVPLTTQRRGMRGSETLYRYHSRVPGGTVSCQGSRVALVATTPSPAARPPEYWTGPRRWEDADYPAG